MTNRDLTYIYPVLDRSGSMAEHLEATRIGYDAFIDEQRRTPGRCLVTLAQFDEHYEIVYNLRDADEVPALVLEPRGGTALLDAIGRTVSAIEAQLSALAESERPAAVLVPILTDGEENSSQEYTWAMVNELINRGTREGWLFSFIGASKDTIATASRIGIKRGQTLKFNAANSDKVLAAYGQNASAYRLATRSGTDTELAAELASFSDDQREMAMAGGDRPEPSDNAPDADSSPPAPASGAQRSQHSQHSQGPSGSSGSSGSAGKGAKGAKGKQ